MYLIDGYNLLYATDFETKNQLISALNKFCVYAKNRVKIVFDGFENVDLSTNLVQVEHTGDADQAIVEIIDMCNNPSCYILVTSDKEILYSARKKNIKAIKSKDFNFTIPEPIKVDADENPDFFLTDNEVEKQLKEFNNFQK